MARDHGDNHNLIFKSPRFWQREQDISHRMPPTITGLTVPHRKRKPTIVNIKVDITWKDSIGGLKT